MNLIAFLLISLGLSMDTFAVSVANGAAIKVLHLNYAFRFAVFFGFFQALMLFIGWLTGLTIANYVQNYSHWLAFALLTFVGLKMIYESTLLKDKSNSNGTGFWIVMGLAFATSIDALSVGISFSLLDYRIIIPVLILGIVTFTASLSGIYIGYKFGTLFEKKMVFSGGVILIIIGILAILQYL